MKRKNIISIILMLVLAVTMCATLVACNNNGTNNSKYTVTFTNGDTVVKTLTELPAGTQLTAEQIPTIDSLPEDKEFKGWFVGVGEDGVEVKAGYTVNGDVRVVAKIVDKSSGDSNIVTVTFKSEGEVISTQPVNKGDTALEPKDPERGAQWRFDGWYFGATEFDFNTPITADITLVAKWTEVVPTSITGSGTKTDPYVLWTANDIINFSSRVNDPATAGNEGYYDAYYRLGKDIDMTGVSNYAPAGKVTTYENANGDEIEVNGFEGVFDGDGHKISNLTMNRSLRSGISNVGFFGVTDKAVIKDVEFENIHYVVEAGADVSSIGANYGGVVGYASLTNLYGVKVSGTIEARLFESNVASIGGIAGALDVYDAKQPRIAYSENCYANVNIIAGAFEDMDVEPSLVGAMVGGLYGFISNSGSAVALVNNASSGSIAGGQYVGGLVAYLESDNVSVINCASNMTVKATAKNSSSYAGGLVGATVRNIIIIDSVFYGTVRGSRPTAVNTSGYAGEIIGYAWDDDYEFTYTAGIAVVNTYHNATLQNAQNRTTYGTKLEQAPTLQWAVTTLGWDAESWTDNNGFVPTSVYAADLRSSATLTLASGNDKTADVREIQGVGGYSVLGSLDALNSADGQVFYAWAIADGVWYRYYMPLVKDVTLNARWQDVSDIVGVYVGTYEYYTGSDAGVIQLNDNGTCQWLSSGSVNGVYRYDGEHIVMVFFNALDEISGTMSGGKMEFMIAQGGTAEIPYTFIKSDLRYFGEYFSEDGDCVVFGGEDLLSINSPVIGTDFYLARFVENGDTLTLTSNWLSNTYSSMTITINEDLTITVNFVGKDPSKSINKVFSKLGTPDYTGEAFVGRYAVSYLAKGDDPYQSVYQLQLNADGSASLWWTIRRTDADGTPSVLWDEYETKGVYYVFGDTVKVSVEGNMSSFTFDAEAGILHGVYNRGVVRNAILIKLADGTEVRDTEIKGFVIDKNIDNVVFVSGDKKFLMKDGVWKQDAVIIGEFNTGSRITIDGVDYLVRYKSYNGNSRWPEYLLDTIGEEEGTYTRNGVSLTLNGIGDINGDVKGNYRVYGKLVSAVLDDDTVFVFDYTAAKAAGGAITDAQHDGYQGVWYMDCTVSVNEWIDDKTQADKKTEVFIEKYYKFFLDGFGHTALVYYSNDYREYRYVWGLDGTGWGIYNKTATGIHVYYNESQTGDVVFYYNMALAYSRSLGYLGESAFHKDGYTGAMTPPSLPAGVAGSYTGAESGGNAVVFNLREDLAGSYKGVPFISVYDGTSKVIFAIDGVDYSFDVTTKVITYGNESVTLTRGGEVTEVIPATLCGTWSGLVSGYGLNPNGELQTIELSANGTLAYEDQSFNATYDAYSNTLTASATGYKFTLKFNEDGTEFKLSLRKGEEERTYEGTFTKAE